MRRSRLFVLIVVLALSSCNKVRKGHELLFNRYRISSPSMSPTLEVGRTFSVMSFDTLTLNQIIAYHPPKLFRHENDDVLYVSRLTGTPGNILEMRQGVLFVDRSPYPFALDLKHGYTVSTSAPLNERRLEGFDFQSYGSDVYRFYMTRSQLQKLKLNKAVVDIKMLYADNDEREPGFPMAVPGDNANNWGPIRIPKKGDQIVLTEENLPFNKTLLEEHEGIRELTIGKTYTLTMDYYFVISDNRHNALDSRYSGFIPISQIDGIVPLKD
jgi:signal peptidase I